MTRRLLALALLAAMGATAGHGQEVASYRIVDDGIPEPLTDSPGNPARGRQIVRDLDKATCLICHQMPIPEEPDHGRIGPPLHGIGARFTPAELRLRVVDAKALDPETVMPSYHRVEGLYRVLERFRGRPIYSAQEVEDVVAYLASLKGSPDAAVAEIPEPAEDEAPRSGYSYLAETTRALQDDDFLNPGMFAVEDGARLWDRVEGSEGKSCASCHEDAAESMRGVATGYPRYDEDAGGLINLETVINEMRTEFMGAEPYAYELDELLALTAFVSHQSRGLPMDVKVDGPAQPFFERGRDYYFTRRGQLDLACTQCHDVAAGMLLRGDVMSQGQVNGFPIYRLMWRSVASRHRMFVWCNTALRAEPDEYGSEDYLALELYVAWRGRGLPIETPAVRR